MAAEVITAEHHDATGAAYLSEGDFWGPIVIWVGSANQPGPNIAYWSGAARNSGVSATSGSRRNGSN